MEFYVLVECEDIIAAFSTLEDCLRWRPTRVLNDPLVIHRIRNLNGDFRIQKIPVVASNFLINE